MMDETGARVQLRQNADLPQEAIEVTGICGLFLILFFGFFLVSLFGFRFFLDLFLGIVSCLLLGLSLLWRLNESFEEGGGFKVLVCMLIKPSTACQAEVFGNMCQFQKHLQNPTVQMWQARKELRELEAQKEEALGDRETQR